MCYKSHEQESKREFECVFYVFGENQIVLREFLLGGEFIS